MNVADSSAFMEYFTNGDNAAFFAPAITNTTELIVPAISLYEVYKKICLCQNEFAAETAVVLMKSGRVIVLDEAIAIRAAKFSIRYKLPMADSIIYATAALHGAILWTQDHHFKGLPNVPFKAKIITP
jgi:predicted nucleic acid-binding protein